MKRNVVWTGALLVGSSLLFFAWKTIGLGMPIVPTEPEGLWRVELEIIARSEGPGGSVRAYLPGSRNGQVVDDEVVTRDRLRFSSTGEDFDRVGIWKGVFSGVHQLAYSFRVQLEPAQVRFPLDASTPPPDEIAQMWGASTAAIPAHAQAVRSYLLHVDLMGPQEPVGRARTLLTFVADEIELFEGASDDALLCLSVRECSGLGKERLLAALLRGSGVPARVIQGFRLAKDRAPERVAWIEAWLGEWVPMSATQGTFGRRDGNLLAVTSNDSDFVAGVGMGAIDYRYRARPEQLRPDELAAVVGPGNAMLASLSLYRLPLGTQNMLRMLLVVPVAALLLALLRNVVGIQSFGTFLPVLIALSLRESNLFVGFLMLAGVVGMGWVSRVLMERLHLLLVPRLCIILCFVVLALTGLALLGRGLEQGSLFSGLLFPIIILAVLIERFSIAVEEDGVRASLVRLAWTVVVTICIYPLFRSEFLARLMFGFPELVVTVIGLLVWVGGYVGYRLSEIIRFRSLLRAEGHAT